MRGQANDSHLLTTSLKFCERSKSSITSFRPLYTSGGQRFFLSGMKETYEKLELGQCESNFQNHKCRKEDEDEQSKRSKR